MEIKLSFYNMLLNRKIGHADHFRSV